MIAIELRFPLGRYHATPWDHHANEGLAEWPPSPLRILRALMAASYRLVPRVAEQSIRELLQKLLTPPSYRLPSASFGHLRHYMPTDDRPTKVFDAFAAIGNEPLIVVWPDGDLTPDEGALLDRILDALGYLGRCESWVEATRLSEWKGEPNCASLDNQQATIDDVRLMTVMPSDQYRQWREGFLAAQELLPRKRRCIPPDDWWQTLQLDTDRLFDEGWSDVPGTMRVSYRLPSLSKQSLSRRARPVRPPTVARFELDSAVLPRLTNALALGDRMRQALIKWSDGLWIFSGRDATGAPMRGHHHAFYLPADDDGDGRLDHITVYCRDGFPAEAVSALERIRRLWGASGHEIRVVLVRLGRVDEVCETPSLPQLGPARTWQSHTPFVLPRHVKRRGDVVLERPEDQLTACLDELGLPTPTTIEPTAAAQANPSIPWHRFLRIRQRGGGSFGSPRGFGFRLQFERPVCGPIAVGYGAHQGLGQFTPVAT